MRLLVTGANGLVGSAVCREGLARGHGVFALVRENSDLSLVPEACTLLFGDFTSYHDASRAITDSRADVVIHAAAVVSTGRPDLEKSLGVNVEGTRHLARAARDGGVKLWLQVSSMSAHADNRSIYGGTKFACDQVVRAAGIPFIIFRPSLVYAGIPRGIFFKLVSICSKASLLPLVGDGSEPVRPIHADDLAATMIRSVGVSSAVGGTYPLGGADPMTFRGLVGEICTGLDRHPRIIPVPRPICRLGALALELISGNPPLTTDNIEGLLRAQFVDHARAGAELGHAPRAFRVGLRESLEEMQSALPGVA
ncbi:NAD-dependent epimerase/dehydratase family protein [Candidatus Sumerlaeota bacterium]|nr:NAD-dependent epimerase/dehydratase family protein [Candidatus Sumerlaeota bacterium]